MRWKPQLSKQRALESAGWLPESFASTTRPPVLRYCEAPKLPSRQRIVAAMSNIVTSVQLAWCVIVLKVFWYCELKLTSSTRLFTSRHLRPRYIKLRILRAPAEEIASGDCVSQAGSTRYVNEFRMENQNWPRFFQLPGSISSRFGSRCLSSSQRTAAPGHWPVSFVRDDKSAFYANYHAGRKKNGGDCFAAQKTKQNKTKQNKTKQNKKTGGQVFFFSN